jgi:hypothetical protein
MKTKILYVQLLEEGAPTFRPTKAEILGNNLYKLLPTEDYDPEDEVWEFLPGSTVSKKEITDIEGNSMFVAIAPSSVI